MTHLTELSPEAEASAEEIKVITKGAVIELWNTVRLLLSVYRDNWSLDDLPSRLAAASSVRPRIPRAAWLQRALDSSARIVESNGLLAEWQG